MTHRFALGCNVYYQPSFTSAAARGIYKIVRHLPVEGDGKLSYRIRSAAEAFERTADEHQLSRAD